MITAVDTSVLLDIFTDDSRFGAASSEALRESIQRGRIVVCDVVWAELAAVFPSEAMMLEKMALLPVDFAPMNRDAATLAGSLWRKYHASGGKRKRVIADFLIGAHALCQCDGLLTRDRGFYRDYFRELQVIQPEG